MIRLVPYDAAWAIRFEEEAAALRSALGALARRIEHVGSTAVPRLIAKPVIAEWPHTHHVHLCESGGRLERMHIAFRDGLRADAGLREQYAALKLELARRHGGATHDERQRYADAKGDFVRRVCAAEACGRASGA